MRRVQPGPRQRLHGDSSPLRTQKGLPASLRWLGLRRNLKPQHDDDRRQGGMVESEVGEMVYYHIDGAEMRGRHDA